MGIIEKILAPINIPRFVKVRQDFDNKKIAKEDLPLHIKRELDKEKILDKIKPNQKIGVTAGSRGISNIALITKEVVNIIKARGAQPYIIPCMGSHGGATAEGQVNILNSLGITEDYIGAPILSSMEVIKIGETISGLEVFIDKNIMTMDQVVIINRIKPHTAFSAEIESGIQKMMAIGMGKQKGAEICHNAGFGQMYKNITEIADLVMKKIEIAFALGIVENAYDETFMCVALKKEDIKEKEKELLKIAKENLAKIMFKDIDVLIIDEIGKNIAGSGMDTNVTGRYATPYVSGGPKISKIVTLDLTEESKGNATGIGHSDFITKRLARKIDLEQTYANALTSTVTIPAKIPVIMPNDLLAIKAGIKTCNRNTEQGIRIVRIKNTLKLEEIWISEALIGQAEESRRINIISDLQDFLFDEYGNLCN